MDRLAALPTDPGFVLHDITLLRLRALLARARRDENRYRGWVEKLSKDGRRLGVRRPYGDGRRNVISSPRR